jgi:hypothetical protein
MGCNSSNKIDPCAGIRVFSTRCHRKKTGWTTHSAIGLSDQMIVTRHMNEILKSGYVGGGASRYLQVWQIDSLRGEIGRRGPIDCCMFTDTNNTIDRLNRGLPIRWGNASQHFQCIK